MIKGKSIMKISKFIKNSMIDFPRRIACVAFTNGCNWKCWYCQNSQLLQETEDKTDELFEFLSQRKGWIDGVVICGGEPTIHNDLPQIIRKIKEMGFDVKLDTNGTNSTMLKELVEQKLIDYVAMDIKASFSKLSEITLNNTKFDEVEKSINFLLENKVEYEFRTTVTPDLTEQDILQIAKKIKGAKTYILQPYRQPDFLKNAPKPLKIETIKHYVDVANEIVPTYLR